MGIKGRRRFLGISAATILAAAGGWLFHSLYRYLSPRDSFSNVQKVTIPLSEVTEGNAKTFELSGNAAVLLHLKGGRYIAFSAVCTHLGCIVQWQPDKEIFLCPCHGGEFSPEGTVIAGPPPRPLRKLPMVIVNNVATVG